MWTLKIKVMPDYWSVWPKTSNSEICFSGFPKNACQGCHISEEAVKNLWYAPHFEGFLITINMQIEFWMETDLTSVTGQRLRASLRRVGRWWSATWFWIVCLYAKLCLSRCKSGRIPIETEKLGRTRHTNQQSKSTKLSRSLSWTAFTITGCATMCPT